METDDTDVTFYNGWFIGVIGRNEGLICHRSNRRSISALVSLASLTYSNERRLVLLEAHFLCQEELELLQANLPASASSGYFLSVRVVQEC